MGAGQTPGTRHVLAGSLLLLASSVGTVTGQNVGTAHNATAPVLATAATLTVAPTLPTPTFSTAAPDCEVGNFELAMWDRAGKETWVTDTYTQLSNGRYHGGYHRTSGNATYYGAVTQGYCNDLKDGRILVART